MKIYTYAFYRKPYEKPEFTKTITGPNVIYADEIARKIALETRTSYLLKEEVKEDEKRI